MSSNEISPRKKRKSSQSASPKRKSLGETQSVSSLGSTLTSNYNKNYKPPKPTSWLDDDEKSKTRKKREKFDISTIRTESDLLNAIAELKQIKVTSLENHEFDAAFEADDNIEKLKEKLQDAKSTAIEKSHQDRVDQLNALKIQERENLGKAWKENFQKHENCAQELRIDLEATQRDKRALIDQEEYQNFHPSRDYLELDRKFQAMIKGSNYLQAQVLLSDLKTREKAERQIWAGKEYGRVSMKRQQFEDKALREQQDLEKRVAEDRLVMEQSQSRSYEELDNKFQNLFQIEDITYNNEKQKLMKRLI